MSEVKRWMIGEEGNLVPCEGPFRWGKVVVLASDHDAEVARLAGQLQGAREQTDALRAELAEVKRDAECMAKERSRALFAALEQCGLPPEKCAEIGIKYAAELLLTAASKDTP